MNLVFVVRNYTLTEETKELFAKKIERLSKFFDAPPTVKATLREVKDKFLLELTLREGGSLLRAEVEADSMTKCIDLCLPKLEKQIQKFHTRRADKARRDRSAQAPAQAPSGFGDIVREKTFKLDTMTPLEAVEQMELVGHTFFVFKNSITATPSVAYIRRDGNYGIIDFTE